MKTLLTALLLFVSTFTFCQTDSTHSVDSTRLPTTLSFSKDVHEYIISLIPDKGNPDKINYFNEVRSQTDSTDTVNHNITVTVPFGMVVEIYKLLGNQREILTTEINASLKQILFTQLMQNPGYNGWTLRSIQVINEEAKKQLQAIIDNGRRFILSLRKQQYSAIP
jgi:hypothetical protein